MNPAQMAQQVRHKLSLVEWPGVDGEVVFGSRGVIITAGTPNEEQIPPSFPFALVILGEGTPDQDHPELITQQLTVAFAVNVVGDPMGQAAAIGSSVQTLGTSAGRGVIEVAERVRSAVENLTGYDGARILISAIRTGQTATIGRGRHLATAEVSLSAVCSSGLHYDAPQMLAYSSGSTTWTWEGTHCENRFDFYQYRLVKLSGSNPSDDPSDGTVVYTGVAPTCVVTKSTGYTYTIFADYSARSAGYVEGSSSPEVGSYV